MKIAVIPARGGSKRIPRKNIKKFCGKPMLAWPLETAIKSELFERVIVSTDDAEIAEVARKYNADVPFVRPAKLSDDYATTADVLAHATHWAIDQGLNVDAVCCIYPTAVFISIDDLMRGWSLLSSNSWEYVFTAKEFDSQFFRAFKQNGEGGVEMFFPEYINARTQDLPQAYHDAGQFYWGRPYAWLNKRKIFSKFSAPIFIQRANSQDIDTPEDWDFAELLFQIANQNTKSE